MNLCWQLDKYLIYAVIFCMIVKYAPFVWKAAGDEYSFIMKCVILNNKEKKQERTAIKDVKKKKKKKTHNCSDRWKYPRKREEVWDTLLDWNEGWIINGGKCPLLIEVFDYKCCVEQLADGHSSSSDKLADIVGMVIYHQTSILLDPSPSARWLSSGVTMICKVLSR